eukprot:CAMPEP_0114999936 /NCGR_PEP_ID=MMETSP0216-20121206/16449_1 /TAXON_ID=223996 /ORGANISM="Protocruzia adherens, Strain Boccale" /LENGTH=187 /DNA_ID=CAMNT_0002364919 /DNA_START=335 /DNA_END=898 /DNA_ORIENTATION=+
MGFFSKLFSSLFGGKKKCKIIVVGLDNSGKTTLINWLKPKKAVVKEVAPTVGFSLEEFSKNNINFTVFDMSGQGKYRNLWEHYYPDAEAIIFVLDSTDRLRFAVAKNELDETLNHDAIRDRNIPILFFANKMDIAGAATPLECMQELELESIPVARSWHITASNALVGEGIEEGIVWLVEQINNRKK